MNGSLGSVQQWAKDWKNQKVINDFNIWAVLEIQLVYSLEGAQNVNVAETLTKGRHRVVWFPNLHKWSQKEVGRYRAARSVSNFYLRHTYSLYDRV